jgi:hypothetical protein
VADAGQSVVLAKHSEGRAATSATRHERRVHAVSTTLDREPARLQESGEGCVRVMLFEIQFRVRVYIEAEGSEVGIGGGDGGHGGTAGGVEVWHSSLLVPPNPVGARAILQLP